MAGERPKTLQIYEDLYAKLSEEASNVAAKARTGEKMDEKTRAVVATSVAQLFALTPRSFEAKFDELCGCLVDRGFASAREAEVLNRLGTAFARRDEGGARAVLEEIERSRGSMPFIDKALPDDEPDDSEEVQAKKGKRGGRKLWNWVGGLLGAVVGGVLGGWSGAGLGFKVGWELGGLIYDATGGGGSSSNVVEGPNGEPCTPPFFHR